jgi:hypothetical protein
VVLRNDGINSYQFKSNHPRISEVHRGHDDESSKKIQRRGACARHVSSKIQLKSFTFDAVMPETSTTETVFKCTGQLAVKEVVRGVNAVVFAYGQSGSGKTYTLLGEGTRGQDETGTYNIEMNSTIEHHDTGRIHGIITMAFKLLQKKLEKRAKEETSSKSCVVSYSIEVSAIEIYLNRVYDLLSNNNQAMRMRTHTIDKTLMQLDQEICELHPREKYEPCCKLKDFEEVLQRVEAVRAQGSTNMNSRSSRSHLILTLAVRRTVEITGVSQHRSKLILVDLAGNERDSARQGKHDETSLAMQGIHVNTSLLALGKSTGTGLYRTSSLTRLLKGYLLHAKIFFIACCSPAVSCTAVTSQTLTYAAMVKLIKTNAEDSALLLEQGMDSFPIKFLPHQALVSHRRILRSDQPVTVYLHELRVSVVRVMVSHRWLTPNKDDPKLAHPDNKQNHKHELMCALFKRLASKEWIHSYHELSVVDWIDFGECAYCFKCSRFIMTLSEIFLLEITCT